MPLELLSDLPRHPLESTLTPQQRQTVEKRKLKLKASWTTSHCYRHPANVHPKSSHQPHSPRVSQHASESPQLLSGGLKLEKEPQMELPLLVLRSLC